MNHSTTRATILPEIIHKIMAHDHLNEDEALKAFYSSAAGASFADDETGLYGQSPNYILAYIWKRRTEAAVDGIPYRTAQAGSSGCQKMRKALGSAMSCRNRSPLTHVKLPTGAETRMS